MKNKGFTLIELLVVISIVTLLSGIILANYRAGEKQYALQRSAHKLAQDIRRAQSMAMAAREIDGQLGHGIELKTGNEFYFSLSCNNANCTRVEEINLEKGIYIHSVSASEELIIIKFFPPDPETIFQPDADSVSITLNYQEGPGKIITVNKAGLIEVEQ